MELEEREREETFRLKRVKEKKSRDARKKEGKGQGEAICCCCLNLYDAEGEEIKEPFCPHCAEGIHSSESSHMTIISDLPQEATQASEREEKKRLETLMSHIDEVMFDLVNQNEDMVTPSTEKFIETCNKFKGTIENFANAPLHLSLCDLCKQNDQSETRVARKPSQDVTFEKMPKEKVSQERGEYYSTKTEEIIKVIKFQNKDGTMSEEKQVITIKTERKGPPEGFTVKAKSEHAKICSKSMENVGQKSKSEGSLAREQWCPACALDEKKKSCPICGTAVSSSSVTGPTTQKKGTSTGENKGTCCVDKVSSKRLSDGQKGVSDVLWKDAHSSTTDMEPQRAESARSCPSCRVKRSSSKQSTGPPSKTTIKIIAKPGPALVVCPTQEYSRSSRSSKSSDCVTCNYGSKANSDTGNTCKLCRKGDGKSMSQPSVCDKCNAVNAKPSSCPECGKEQKKPPAHTCPICKTQASTCPGCGQKKEDTPKCSKCNKPIEKSKQCPSCGNPKDEKKSVKSSLSNKSCSVCAKEVDEEESEDKPACPECGKDKEKEAKPTCPACGKSASESGISKTT